PTAAEPDPLCHLEHSWLHHLDHHPRHAPSPGPAYPPLTTPAACPHSPARHTTTDRKRPPDARLPPPLPAPQPNSHPTAPTGQTPRSHSGTPPPDVDHTQQTRTLKNWPHHGHAAPLDLDERFSAAR